MKIPNQQISIRDWKEEDAEKYRFWNTGKHLWMEYDGPYYPKSTAKEVEESIIRFNKITSEFSEQDTRRRMFIADNKTDQLIGIVSWYWQSEETNWKSIGIVIYDEAFWSKGVGYEALSVWIDYLFEADQGMARLDLRTWSGNFGMMKLATKLGFMEEARFRKARIVKGEYYDSIGMGILREEWEGR